MLLSRFILFKLYNAERLMVIPKDQWIKFDNEHSHNAFGMDKQLTQ